MDINKVLKVCNKNKHYAYVQENEKTWWLGDGYSLYCLNDVKRLTPEYITALAGISAVDVEASTFVKKDIEELPFDFSDNAEETLISKAPITVTFDEGEYTPIYSTKGIRFIPTRLFDPVKKDEFDIYERYSDSGDVYFVIKIGMFCCAIILDQLYHIDFATSSIIEKLSRYTTLAYKNYENSLKTTKGDIK